MMFMDNTNRNYNETIRQHVWNGKRFGSKERLQECEREEEIRRGI